LTATIHPIVSQDAVDDAWEALVAHRAPLADNPRLLTDRGFMEKDVRLHERFRRLFLAMEQRP